ncbi:xylulokinase [Neobacillus sp. 19]|uniref:xylulokinase n=1 Tax=Neobacillus sp. 19 TaxID=3394458 RepID=UPI003BF6473B
MKYVIGIDLGTSAVKILLVNQNGDVVQEVSKPYPLIQEKTGYSEQDPKCWVDQTVSGLSDLLKDFEGNTAEIEGISFSGQMHGLVLVDKDYNVLRNAILWNDTRTTKQCQDIYKVVGEKTLLAIAKNHALEGFTLPKLLWVKEYEPDVYANIHKMMLPKDYLRFRITGNINCEYSDAAGTLLLDIQQKVWSKEITSLLDIDEGILPELVESTDFTGTITQAFANETGLHPATKVFAGGADNACGAVGSGILSKGMTMCSIGTSGVVLSYEESADLDFEGKVHYFNHAEKDAYYTMGVTLAAGHSLSWYKNTFAPDESFDDLLSHLNEVPIGANGLLFTPYLSGERTPFNDAAIRGSFIGMDISHSKEDFTRAVIEGITFSLNESIEIFRGNGKTIDTIISIGGGAKNEDWLQIQADIFNANVVKLASEQGPALGAAMIAASGLGWFHSMKDFSNNIVKDSKTYSPNEENVKKYKKLFTLYQGVYRQTRELNQLLSEFR